MSGISNLYIGDEQLPTSNAIYLGEDAVNTIYLGEDVVYSSGPFVGLKVKPLELLFNNASLTKEITIRSSEDWTITDDSGGWLSYSTTTGTTGKTVVTVSATTTQADRTATITITTANYSETISVSQLFVIFIDYVYTTSDAFVNTSIVPTVNTKFRVKLKQTGRYGGTIVGYGSDYGGETPIACEDDWTDYRYFNHNSQTTCVFDFNSSRIGPLGLTYDANGLYDLTFGNNYIHDNVANTESTGATQSSIATQRNVPIFINLNTSHAQIHQVTIYGDNDTVVFDGYAAEVDGVYGIYDNVGNTLLQPTNSETVYGGTWQ